jgi:hypothetical protein
VNARRLRAEISAPGALRGAISLRKAHVSAAPHRASLAMRLTVTGLGHRVAAPRTIARL